MNKTAKTKQDRISALRARTAAIRQRLADRRKAREEARQ